MTTSAPQLPMPSGPAAKGAAPAPPRPLAAASGRARLTGAQKAAIVVRFLLAEELEPPVELLSPEAQARLTQTMGTMGLIDRATLLAVLSEFLDMLEQVGLAFPDGLEDAISLLEGKLDQRAAQTLRALSRGSEHADPWRILEQAEVEELLPILSRESLMVGAVLLSKLSTDKAAKLLMRLPPQQAQALALAIGRTEGTPPATVAQIGATLVEFLKARPDRAFTAPPSKRMGEILNAAPTALREQLLRDLEAGDADFASLVRAALFTFHDIPRRVAVADVPALMRDVPAKEMQAIIAMADPADAEAIAFLLDNMSKRAAEALRDEASDQAPPEPEAYQAAVLKVSGTVRRLVDSGKITLLKAG